MATDTSKLELTGMNKFEAGAVGTNGAMGSTLTAYLVKDGTANLNLAEATVSTVKVYGSDADYAAFDIAATKDFTVEIMGLKLSMLPTFFGGTYTASIATVPDAWEPPVKTPNIVLSVKMSTVDAAGGVIALNFPKCKVTTSLTGALEANMSNGVKVKFTVLSPIDGSGAALPYMKITGVSAS